MAGLSRSNNSVEEWHNAFANRVITGTMSIRRVQFVATQFVAHSIRRTHSVACYNCLIACNPFCIPIKKKNKRAYQLITGYLLC